MFCILSTMPFAFSYFYRHSTNVGQTITIHQSSDISLLFYGVIYRACTQNKMSWSLFFFPSRKYNESDKFQVDWQTLKSIGLIVLSLILFAIALMNISLAFFLTATMMPVCTFVVPTKSRWVNECSLFQITIDNRIFVKYTKYSTITHFCSVACALKFSKVQ